MDITSHLYDCLQLHPEGVVVPELGKFVYTETDGKRVLEFNHRITFDDGVLSEYIASREFISVEEAQTELSTFTQLIVNEVTPLLAKNNREALNAWRFSLGNLGSIGVNDFGDMYLIPAEEDGLTAAPVNNDTPNTPANDDFSGTPTSFDFVPEQPKEDKPEEKKPENKPLFPPTMNTREVTPTRKYDEPANPKPKNEPKKPAPTPTKGPNKGKTTTKEEKKKKGGPSFFFIILMLIFILILLALSSYFIKIPYVSDYVRPYIEILLGKKQDKPTSIDMPATLPADNSELNDSLKVAQGNEFEENTNIQDALNPNNDKPSQTSDNGKTEPAKTEVKNDKLNSGKTEPSKSEKTDKNDKLGSGKLGSNKTDKNDKLSNNTKPEKTQPTKPNTKPNTTQGSAMSTGKYIVVVGSFESRKNADAYVAKLTQSGYKAGVHETWNEFFRVYVDAYDDIKEATKVADSLRSTGDFNGCWVAKR